MNIRDKFSNGIKKYWEIIVIFFFSLTPLLWLKGSEVIIGHDSGFRLNYLDHLRNLFFSWNPVQNFGADWGILKGFLIIQAPETFFHRPPAPFSEAVQYFTSTPDHEQPRWS